MHSISIERRGKVRDFFLPEKWDELTVKQFKQVYKYLYDSKGFNPKLILFFKLLGISKRMGRKLGTELIEAKILKETLELIQFVESPNIMVIHNSLLPKIGLFQGPGFLLGNLTVNQFGFAELFCNKYLQSQTDEDLNNFMAVLYRFMGIQFSEDHDRLYYYSAKIFISKPTKLLAVINFLGLCRGLKDHFPLVFSGGGDADQGDSSGNRFGMVGLMLSQSGGKFGTFREVKNELLLPFLTELEMATDRYLKEKAEMERLKNKHSH